MNDQSVERTNDVNLERVVELLLSELRQGGETSLERLLQQFPELAAEIQELWSTLAVLEFAKAEPDDPTRSQSDTLAFEEPSILPTIENYELIREVGRGGMGIVYEARQIPLNRAVALKILPTGLSQPESSQMRFATESKAAAKLQHPRIVPVFDAGVSNGYQYYAMQFVSGLNLKQAFAMVSDWQSSADGLVSESANSRSMVLVGALFNVRDPSNTKSLISTIEQILIARGQRNSPEPDHSKQVTPKFSRFPRDLSNYRTNMARILREIAHAVASAHDQGVLHRDIKPSNIMLDFQIQPWLCDFGLAKTDENEITNSGDVVGTLCYLAPERLKGTNSFGADIYGLGATLYELVTLRPLIMAREPSQALHDILHRQPTPPRQIDPRIPADLETIILKAVAKDPAERYASARELADDLGRYIEGRPVLARPVSTWQHLWSWARRNKAVSGSLTALAVVILATTLGSIWAAWTFYDMADNEKIMRLNMERAKESAEESFRLEQQAKAEEQVQRQFAQAINDFVINDILALTSVEGQSRFDQLGTSLGHDVGVRELLDRAANRLVTRTDLEPRTQAELNRIIGISYRATGELERGRPYLDRAVALYSAAAGPEAPETLRAKNSLAANLSAAGDWDAASSLTNDVYERTLRRLGPKHIDTIIAQFRIDQGNAVAGHYEQAIPALKQRVVQLTEALGPADAQTLHARGFLADTLRESGDPQAAATICLDALATANRELGDLHLSTLDLRGLMADIYLTLDELELGQEMAQTVFDQLVEVLGANDAHTLAAQARLGFFARRAGDLATATGLLEAAQTGLQQRLGEGNPVLIQLLRERGCLHKDTGDYENGLRCLEQAVHSASTGGRSRPNTLLRLRIEILDALLRLNRNNEAWETANELQEPVLKAFGSGHPDRVTCLNYLAEASMRINRLDIAESTLLAALDELRSRNFPSWKALTEINLASLWLAQGKPKEVTKMLTGTLQTLNQVSPQAGGPESRKRIVQVRSRLGAAYEQQGDLGEAIHQWQTAWAECQADLGAIHPLTLSLSNNLAFGLMKQGEFARAVELLEPILDERQTPQILDKELQLNLMNNLGNAYSQLDRTGEAVAMLQRVLDRSKELFPPGSPKLLLAYRNLGVMFHNHDQFEQAANIFLEAWQSTATALGAEHPQTLRLAGNLGMNYWKLGETDRAVEVLKPVEIAAIKVPQLAFCRLTLLRALSKAGDSSLFLEVADRYGNQLASQSRQSPESLANGFREIGELAVVAGAVENAKMWLLKAAEEYDRQGLEEMADSCRERAAELKEISSAAPAQPV